MKSFQIVILAGVTLTACSRTPPAVAPAAKIEANEPLRTTVWTPNGELFLEHQALVAGVKSRFAIHLTRLSDFHAVREASCDVELQQPDKESQRFPCDASTHPGIFGANVQPGTAGEGRLSIRVRGKDLTETFDAGMVKIAADAASAEQPAAATEETISFLKEQQWALDFGTQLAVEQTLRDSLRVAAETLPRTGGEAAVIAPLAGRLVVEKVLAVGTAVEKGAELCAIVPPAGAAADLPGLQLAESEALVTLEQARRDQTRAERLLAAGAVPTRRVEEARTAEAMAQTRLQAARARLAQYEATRAADGTETGVKRFLVRAPISGTITESAAISGAGAEVGKVLFRIVDINTLHVSGVVAESDYPKLRQLSGAEIEMPGSGALRAAGKLIGVGHVVDAATRTVPVVYEIDNRDHFLAVNQTVFLRLLLTAADRKPAIPEAAIIDDAGRPVVFVQRSGETFLRRPVKTGVRSGGFVQILSGVEAGDRVVTRGAYLIRLSTMSSAVPAHGHVH